MASFSAQFTIEWGDCDEAGVVFYPNYFYWLDCTFQKLLRSKGLGQRQNQQLFGGVTPLVDVGLKFRSPARYDQVIRIEAGVEEWEERRFKIGYRILCDDKIVAEGYEVRAWAVITDDGLKGSQVPEDFRRRIE